MILTSTNKLKFTVSGCSISVGEGIPNEKDSPENYINIISKYYNADCKNLAKKGNSNYNIFLTSLAELTFNTPDILFVQWTTLNRAWFHPGPNVEKLIILNDFSEFRYGNIYFSKRDMRRMVEWFYLLNHIFNAVLDVIKYSQILQKLSADKTTRIVFLNAGLPWTNEITDLTALENKFINFSEFTKSLVNFNETTDEEIDQAFCELYNEISKLDFSLWANMFSSFAKAKVDVGTDNMHPGVNSHKLFAETVIQYLQSNQ